MLIWFAVKKKKLLLTFKKHLESHLNRPTRAKTSEGHGLRIDHHHHYPAKLIIVILFSTRK
ncbi:hypothetical protein BpHYR1_046246 [Brachionus plicatilis]|uniref:Uncharacterized protein n=1 Tax=Brachionus plicatilis TaxID=10195 RepID=A0A3M7RAR0_BRAPC|nr:hypothetical protein BpHYR1_046246 [Brachionus plicatilis]